MALPDGVDHLSDLAEYESRLRVLDVVAAAPGDDVVGAGFHGGEFHLQPLPDPFHDPLFLAGWAFGHSVGDDGRRHRAQRRLPQLCPRLSLGAADVELFPVHL